MTVPGSIATQDGNIALSTSQYWQIADLLNRVSGIALPDGSEKLVVARLSRHLRRLGHDDFRSYLTLVTSPSGKDELALMVAALTTNTTRFFREPAHFEILERELLPRLARKAHKGGRVRVWSAACSSGEEPYSIAANMLSAIPDAGRLDVKILATDINKSVLAAGQAGWYPTEAIRDLPQDRVVQMFDPCVAHGRMRVRESLRKLVSFRYMNFVEDWPVSGPFDAIFCRNVVIYMDQPTRRKIWTGLERALDRDGCLFIGHSERIAPGLSDRLELFGPTSLRRPDSKAWSDQPPCDGA